MGRRFNYEGLPKESDWGYDVGGKVGEMPNYNITLKKIQTMFM